MEIKTIIHNAAKYLPTQGPISVFVHHNPLHHFEDEDFIDATRKAEKIFGYKCFMHESYYREKIIEGRIKKSSLIKAIQDKCSTYCNDKIGDLGSKLEIIFELLVHNITPPQHAELPWLIYETPLLQRFISNLEVEKKQKILNLEKGILSSHLDKSHVNRYIERYGTMHHWSSEIWEKVISHVLWNICYDHIKAVLTKNIDSTKIFQNSISSYNKSTEINEFLIKFCAAYVDQGFSQIPLPERDQSLLKCFSSIYRDSNIAYPSWITRAAIRASSSEKVFDLINHCLIQLEISNEETDEYIRNQLLELGGWAGMLYQLETVAAWAPRRVPEGTLYEYIALRLLLASEYQSINSDYDKEVHIENSKDNESEILSLTYTLFSLAQYKCWSTKDLLSLSEIDWSNLVSTIRSTDSFVRCSIFQEAFESDFYDMTLATIDKGLHEIPQGHAQEKSFQIVCCIDDREESFRRHIEEVDPYCETLGAAGFFSVAMFYHALDEAHFRPLCPVSITPQHWVQEEPIFTSHSANKKRTERRKYLGLINKELHLRSKSLFGGAVVGLFGFFAGVPLLARVLLPKYSARLSEFMDVFFGKTSTELHIERESDIPGPEYHSLGFSVSEMALIVKKTLNDIGLTENFAPLVIFCGHGSSSINNPHESAYNCGACSGGRGGANARAFSLMANDPRVRFMLSEQGFDIPASVHFVGAYHDTCKDKVEFYDLDAIPRSLRDDFREVEATINKALTRNAHERCRRFGHVARNLPRALAREHVYERSEDLSQARPEYNHATNALCLVGNREWSRGIYLDRRAFLMSYDPSKENDEGETLEGILKAVVPVCAGINLEYYFSTVDPEGFGCGSKLPHNVSGLVGVTSGASSDLRPGLSAQMVEIHEPLRILFIVESKLETIEKIFKRTPSLKKVVVNNWIRLALLDPQTRELGYYSSKGLSKFHSDQSTVLTKSSSHVHYSSSDSYLPFVKISKQEGVR